VLIRGWLCLRLEGILVSTRIIVVVIIVILLILRAGLSIVPVVPWEGPPVAKGPRRSAAKFLPRCFDV